MPANMQVVILVGEGVLQTALLGVDLYSQFPHDGTVLWYDFEGPLTSGPDPVRTSNTGLIGIEDIVEDEINAEFSQVYTTRPTDPREDMSLANAKLATINAAYKISWGRILEAYPIQTQLDITRAAINPLTGVAWTGGNLTTMTTFIDDEYTDLAARITAINACVDVPAVIAFDPWA